MSLVAMFLLMFCPIPSNNLCSEIWTSDCENEYALCLEVPDGWEGAVFYGILIENDQRLYYKAACEEVVRTDSTLSFQLNDFSFSTKPVLGARSENLFKRPGSYFMLPCSADGTLSFKTGALRLNVFTGGAFSNFEEATFTRTQ